MTNTLYQQLEALRPALVRFAILQLRSDSLAEDVVQDALLAVLEKPDSFAGQSTLRTYVTGILKYKIIDALRLAKRTLPIVANEDQSEDDVIDALFRANGHTHTMPNNWGDPDATLERQAFFRVMEICLENLPPKTARIFMMRDWLALETD